jgi:hypothetical protein
MSSKDSLYVKCCLALCFSAFCAHWAHCAGGEEAGSSRAKVGAGLGGGGGGGGAQGAVRRLGSGLWVLGSALCDLRSMPCSA